MAETITIQLPENAHDREEVWQYLLERRLVSTPPSTQKKGKFADLAQQYRRDNLLTGLGSELSKARKEFREGYYALVSLYKLGERVEYET